MRPITRFLTLLASTLLISSAALAQAYPERPVRVIVPFPAGGGADVVMRVLQPRMAEVLGQPIVIENRAGAGGSIGTEATARATPDGYTVMVATVAQAINHTLTNPPWDLIKDFTPVGLMVLNQSVLAAHPAFPANNVKELIELARQKPDAVRYASFGTGSSAHMNAELFKMMTKTEMLHVPYKGAAPAVNDVIGGQVDIIFSDIAAIISHIKAGKAKALAIASASEFDGLPGVPTIDKAGVPGYETGGFLAMIAPAGTPKVAVDKLNAALNEALKAPETRARLESMAGIPMGGTPERLGQFLQTEVNKWAGVIKTAGIKVN